jgi:hypothetical protein
MELEVNVIEFGGLYDKTLKLSFLIFFDSNCLFLVEQLNNFILTFFLIISGRFCNLFAPLNKSLFIPFYFKVNL